MQLFFLVQSISCHFSLDSKFVEKRDISRKKGFQLYFSANLGNQFGFYG